MRNPKTRSKTAGAAAVPKRSKQNAGSARADRTPKRTTVTFRLRAPHAEKVDVAGTFSNWVLRQMKKRKDGTWTASLRPPPGIHEYKFLVDHEWVEDPNNPEKVHNGFGGCNSVCRIE